MTSSNHSSGSAVFTEEDVIRRALEPEQLGIDATPGAIREWGEWIHPMVPLQQAGFEQKVEAIREEMKSQKSSGEKNYEK